ncbi:hypothetical protein VARIO8X_90207 [Burkholderiales bacterium 8X]|nr:hypothetical protein VARIO8X_90207 [Burkholderiales bacterium 8X]
MGAQPQIRRDQLHADRPLGQHLLRARGEQGLRCQERRGAAGQGQGRQRRAVRRLDPGPLSGADPRELQPLDRHQAQPGAVQGRCAGRHGSGRRRGAGHFRGAQLGDADGQRRQAARLGDHQPETVCARRRRADAGGIWLEGFRCRLLVRAGRAGRASERDRAEALRRECRGARRPRRAHQAAIARLRTRAVAIDGRLPQAGRAGRRGIAQGGGNARHQGELSDGSGIDPIDPAAQAVRRRSERAPSEQER